MPAKKPRCIQVIVAPHKGDLLLIMVFYQKVLLFFLLLHENICCGSSVEAPCLNEFPQHMFSWRDTGIKNDTKKNDAKVCVSA